MKKVYKSKIDDKAKGDWLSCLDCGFKAVFFQAKTNTYLCRRCGTIHERVGKLRKIRIK